MTATPPLSSSPPATSPAARDLALLVALATLSALWSCFLWAELVLARQGGEAFCALGEGANCVALWDGAFASAVHEWTRLPVAAWGLVWSLAGLGLPLVALLQRAEGSVPAWALSALRATGMAGALAALILAGVALQAGVFCAGCAVTYALVALYGYIALWRLAPFGWPDLSGGLGRAAALVAAAFALLYYPGSHTPAAPARAAEQALRQVAAATGAPSPQGASPESASPHAPAVPGGPAPHGLGEGPLTGDDERDARLFDLVRTLPPQLRQGLADSLFLYDQSARLPQGEPRLLEGDPRAPLRITEWTDARCGHCAALHDTWKQIRPIAPVGSFSVDARHFPLDGNCNPHIQRKSPDGVSCLAARAQICLEGNAGHAAFVEALFAEQASLTTERIYALAAPYLSPDALRACTESAQTQTKLSDDIELAMSHQLDGTPLVVVGGKKGTAFGPFLYAMILSGGSSRHPAFRELPAPNPHAHMH